MCLLDEVCWCCAVSGLTLCCVKPMKIILNVARCAWAGQVTLVSSEGTHIVVSEPVARRGNHVISHLRLRGLRSRAQLGVHSGYVAS